MPIRDFKCINEDCRYEFETRYLSSKVADAEFNSPGVYCPKCGERCIRAVSLPARPRFNGTGFYETDYKNK
jgi:predicted nucleic acid-binding Zn ribbon protein